MSPALGIALVLVCVLVEGFFSGSEIALVSADRLRLQARADEGHKGSATALSLLESEERLLGTCLIGTNVCTITGTTVVAAMLVAAGYRSEWLVAVVFSPITLIIGEALPKTVYQHHATAIAPVVAPILRGIQTALTPLLAIVGGWTKVLDVAVGSDEPQDSVTRQELLLLLQGPTDSDIAPEEHRILRRVFAFTDTVVEECMTPLVDVDAIDIEITVGDAVHAALEAGHSRLPVYEERVDNLVGLVEVRDLLFAAADELPLRTLVRPVLFVPEAAPVNDLLREFRTKSEHFAVVVDEYGGSVGVVTTEDLLEEIVGEIRDERDDEEHDIRRISDRVWRMGGRTELETVESVTGRDLPEGEYETVAGLVLDNLGHIPLTGQVVELPDVTIRVDEASERAVLQVTVTWR